jgi:hypothetical protein
MVAMAAPMKTGKQSVKLGAPVRVSRIRRDPPPIAKKIIERDPDERDTRVVVIGVVAFAIAIAIITIAFSSGIGWSPSQYTVEINNL